MKVGTIIRIDRTCSGCLGAENRTGVVTDEVADHGLLPSRPGYNVALFINGKIWRINEDAKVKILSRPHD